MSSFFNSLSSLEIVFLVIGFAGQVIFASRFVIQWIHSEKKGDKGKIHGKKFHLFLVCTQKAHKL